MQVGTCITLIQHSTYTNNSNMCKLKILFPSSNNPMRDSFDIKFYLDTQEIESGFVSLFIYF